MKRRIKGNPVSVFRKIFFLAIIGFLMPLAVSAQQITVKGKVKDAGNSPLIGVTVVAKGTTTGAITNIDGQFTISVADKQTLVFSMIGFQTQEVIVNGTNAIEIIMAEELKAIDEIVVVGYGSVKKKDLTTAVSVVSTKDIDERPITSAAAAIQGKAAGVSVVQPSGEPGAGMVVRIRGNTSISASNDPLYVVDGVPMDDISFLSANDIESMQILKDASSAAIYGSRASNGVVLINTKAGTKGDAKITFNSSYGFENVVRQMSSLNVTQYKDLMDEIGGITVPSGLTDKTNWFNETYRTGTTQNYQLSFAGATDKMKYYISGGLIQDVGIIKVAYFKRYNFRTNLENQIRPWLKITSNVAYSDYSNNGIISGAGSNRAGVILSVINTPTYAPIWDPNIPGRYYNNFYGAQTTSPVENMSRTADNVNRNNQLVGSVAADISFTKDLKFRSSIAIDRNDYNGTSWLDPTLTTYGRSLYGNATDTRSLNTVMTYDNYFTYERSFGKHNLSAMAGYSYTASLWSQSYVGSSYFMNSLIKTTNAGNKVDQSSGSQASEWAISSFIGRLAYNYNSKYLFTANFRADGSSKLAPGHQWGYFPSFSAAWRVSGESFMTDISWLSDLKLRLGWGQTGNQSGIGDNGWMALYNITRQNWWETGKTNSLPTLQPATMLNVDLTWETTSQSNLGIDFSILKNRITLSADVYYKYTTNLLINVPLPATAPVSSLTRNEGEMSNKGIEFSLSTKNIESDFRWETEFNISFNRNKVEKLTLQPVYYYGQTSEATSENVVRMSAGQPLSMFWGYISEGVDPETGNLKFKDVSGDGKVTLSDKTYIGNPNPKFTYGITNTFSYKGFSLNVFLQGSYGNDIYNASRMETEGMYDAKNQSTAVLYRWRRPGQITNMPRATSAKDNLVASSRFVEDGSYLRVKTLTLSYNFQGGILKTLKIAKIQPYFTTQNLLTFTKYSGFDPEVNQYGGSALTQGIDWGTYPQSKSYIFGLNVEF